jgi:hypothetical protein
VQMEQGSITEILNRQVFGQEKTALLQAIAKYPDRFVGVFRSTTPRLKLLQNLLQSREIRFGDALEEIIGGLILAMGFEPLAKRLQVENADSLSCDQYFCNPDHTKYYLIEQKVRDDHDSTKKRGQIENFGRKLQHLRALHGTALSGIMYFIDPALRKNENYYRKELATLQQQLEIPITLYYNGELFQHLQGHTQTWDLLLNTLQLWRKTAPEQITLDYDADSERTVEEIADIPIAIWGKLISNDALWESGVFHILFPKGSALKLITQRFKVLSVTKIGRSKVSYDQLAHLLQTRLKQFYGFLDD